MPWAAADSGADGQSVQTPPDRMQPALTEEEEGYLQQLQRLQAEFANYRKRTLRETRRLGSRAKGELVASLIPVLDGLTRARESHAANPAERRGGGSASDPLASRGSALRRRSGETGRRRRERHSIRTFMRRWPARLRTSIPRGRSSIPCSRGISSTGCSCAPRGCGSHRVLRCHLRLTSPRPIRPDSGWSATIRGSPRS